VNTGNDYWALGKGYSALVEMFHTALLSVEGWKGKPVRCFFIAEHFTACFYWRHLQ
jgi:hypothetical protein